LKDEEERNRLKQLVKSLVKDDSGIIIRTEAAGCSEEELIKDFNELKEKLKENEDLEAYRHIFSISSMLRNMERAGDHTINICEHIIYLIKGQHYDFG
ncbi:MAG: ribonuclease E/G, partial [Erysipelotrichaceae bacterium]